MILYKYRSLANFELIIDIILNQRLHCSTYPELNDPFEGLFVTTTNITFSDFKRMGKNPPLFVKLPIKFEKVNEARDLLDGAIDKVKICSLSSDLNDVRLWSYYANEHKGIVFEIEFSESETIYEVTYSKKLPSSSWWTLSTILGGQPSIYDVLSRKTKHWEFESEYRIIDENKNLEEGSFFGIKDGIKAIYLGTRTSEKQRALLLKLTQGKIPIWTTKINMEKIIVEPDKLIGERERDS